MIFNNLSSIFRNILGETKIYPVLKVEEELGLKIMSLLKSSDERLTVQTLSRILNEDRKKVTKALDFLRSMGLVEYGGEAGHSFIMLK